MLLQQTASIYETACVFAGEALMTGGTFGANVETRNADCELDAGTIFSETELSGSIAWCVCRRLHCCTRTSLYRYTTNRQLHSSRSTTVSCTTSSTHYWNYSCQYYSLKLVQYSRVPCRLIAYLLHGISLRGRLENPDSLPTPPWYQLTRPAWPSSTINPPYYLLGGGSGR